MGHGVFGGMLSVLFMQQMRSLVEIAGLWNPERLAAELDKNLSQLFRSASDHPITVDGTIGVLDMGRRRLTYTSLKGKGYLLREGQLHKLHTYPFSFGEGLGASAEEHELELQPGDRLYFLSDGLANQRYPAQDRPLGTKGVTDLLLSLQSLPIHQQKDALLTELHRLCSAGLQNDDVIVVGMEIE
ncbi:MAG: SpoIIE family protein phosphatase [Bacteroidia bacterium]